MELAIVLHEPGIPSRRWSLASVDYVPALCTHRPSLLPIECFSEVLGLFAWWLTLPSRREDDQTVALRGSKSRNKVSVGEPAEGSLEVLCMLCVCKHFASAGDTHSVSTRTFGLSAVRCQVVRSAATLRWRQWVADCPLGHRCCSQLKELAGHQRGFAVPLPPSREDVVQQFVFLSTPLMPSGKREPKKQCYTVDQLAWGSVKNAAKCVTQCELQDT